MNVGTIGDGHGNHLIIRFDDKQFNLFLRLKSDRKTRRIGYVRNNVYYKFENKDGIFRTLNAFGFCNDAIVQTNPDSVVVYYNGTRYYISKERFDKYKTFLEFSKQGFERRAYVPLPFFKRSR